MIGKIIKWMVLIIIILLIASSLGCMEMIEEARGEEIREENDIEVCTDYDGGSSTESFTVNETDIHVDLDSWHFNFRVLNASGVELSFNDLTNQTDSLPTEHRPYYTYDIDNYNWSRMDDDLGGGFNFTPAEDVVYISHIPYYNLNDTYDFVERIENKDKDYIDTEVIGQSTEGRNIHVIRVNPTNSTKEEAQHFTSIARQHPSEYEGSPQTEGMVEYLIEMVEEEKRGYDEEIIYHIIPNMNPDGVYHGHERNTHGVNFNREWDKDEPVEGVQVVMDYWKDQIPEENYLFGIDLHSFRSVSDTVETRGPSGYVYDFNISSEEGAVINDFDDVSLTSSGIGWVDERQHRRSRDFIWRNWEGIQISTEAYKHYHFEDMDPIEHHTEKGYLMMESVVYHNSEEPPEPGDPGYWEPDDETQEEYPITTEIFYFFWRYTEWILLGLLGLILIAIARRDRR